MSTSPVAHRFLESTVASRARTNTMSSSSDGSDRPQSSKSTAVVSSTSVGKVTSMRARFETLSAPTVASMGRAVKPAQHWTANVLAHDPADKSKLLKATVGRFRTKRLSDMNLQESSFFQLPGGNVLVVVNCIATSDGSQKSATASTSSSLQRLAGAFQPKLVSSRCSLVGGSTRKLAALASAARLLR
jgi:hypothetical protein